MRVITGGALRRYWELPDCSEAEQPLKAWYAETVRASWKGSADIAELHRSVTFFGHGLAAFALSGGSIRLVAEVNYPIGIVFVRFIGSAEELASAWGRAVA